jgi:hypothetical protein
MIPPALPSVWPYLGIFAVFLLIFHIWLVWRRPLSDIGWRKVDYIWLGLSVTGIVIAASQWRGQVASDTLKETEALWRNLTITGLLGPSKGMRAAMCERAPRPDPDGCKWFDATIVDMERAGVTTSGWLAVALPPTGGLREDFKQEADNIVTSLGNVRNEALKRQVLEQAAAPDNDRLFISLGLFPIALALRITKVSGEIRLAQLKGRSPSVRY